MPSQTQDDHDTEMQDASVAGDAVPEVSVDRSRPKDDHYRIRVVWTL